MGNIYKQISWQARYP